MEIGSVLELDEWKQYSVVKDRKPFWLPFMKEKAYKTIFYQSGRNAIEGLLLFLKETKGINRVLIPDYMCDTVKDATHRAQVPVEQYKVDREYGIQIDEIDRQVNEKSCLFVAHFFGKRIDKNLLSSIGKWKKQGVIVIEDVTLSLFSSDKGECVGFGTYTLGSIRKWLPVPDGCFLASATAKLPQEVERTCVSKYTDFYYTVQSMKRQYIQGGCQDKELKKIYLDYYRLSIDELFSDYELYPMSQWTQNYLQNYDIQAVIKKRMENYDYLYSRLQNISGLTLKVERRGGFLPLGMVMTVENRNGLLQFLISKDIYCNVHWRLQPSDGNEDLNFLSNHSITVPCDQRYGIEEMNYIADALEEWFRR